jgi:hypothetical protein
MKALITGLTFILFAKMTIAQKELLSIDEHNKYIYYQVVDMPGTTADTLNRRGVYFLEKVVPKIKLKETERTLSGAGKFITFSGVSILKHEDGEITYLTKVEFRDNKYRYWLTDFTFTPYQRDRYGNFVPRQGIAISLETALTKLSKKEVDSYLDQTGVFCKQLGDSLKQALIAQTAQKKVEIIKKVVTDKW